MTRKSRNPPLGVLPLFSDDEGDNAGEGDDKVLAPSRREPAAAAQAVRPAGRRTNNSLATLLDNTTANVAVELKDAVVSSNRRASRAQRRSSKERERSGDSDSFDSGNFAPTEGVHESETARSMFRRASTGSLIVVRLRRAMNTSGATEAANPSRVKPRHNTRSQSLVPSLAASEAARSDVEEEIPHASLSPTSEDDWPE
ncbi:hypothetical protein LTR95_005981 [Oleoguttula sp. CCFEE 5521]